MWAVAYTDKTCIWKILTWTQNMNISVSYTCTHTTLALWLEYNVIIYVMYFNCWTDVCRHLYLFLCLFILWHLFEIVNSKRAVTMSVSCLQCPVEHNSLSNACLILPIKMVMLMTLRKNRAYNLTLNTFCTLRNIYCKWPCSQFHIL